MIWYDKDIDLTIPVNIVPLVDDTDFKSIETGIVFNEPGMDLVWNFMNTSGIFTQTAVVPTGAGDYLWTNQGNGMYSILIPAAGGGSINNDSTGFGWFTGICTGVLVWRSPIIGIRGYELNNSLIDDGDAIALESTLNSVLNSLRQYKVQTTKFITTNNIEIKRSTDISYQIYGLGDLTARTSLYFTVKKMSEKDSATDAQSIIQIEETAGLLYINKNAAGVPANGSITVTDALAGTLTIELAAVESNKLDPNEAYLYDVKMDNTVMVEGRFFISTAITRTLT